MRIRVATYNAENFFDTDTSIGGRPKESSEIRFMARVVNAMKADVIALQEVESLAAMRFLNEQLKEPYEYVRFQKGNYRRNLHLGYLSRFPVQLKTHKDVILRRRNGSTLMEYPFEGAEKKVSAKFQRDLLRARLRLASGSHLTLFNHHLKSQKNYEWLATSADTIREAEARAAASVIADYVAAKPNEPVAALGDLNKPAGSKSIRALNPGLGFLDIIEKDLGSGEYVYTYHPKSWRERIDHILLSPAAADRYRSNSVRIVKTKLAFKASDHLPVYADLSY